MTATGRPRLRLAITVPAISLVREQAEAPYDEGSQSDQSESCNRHRWRWQFGPDRGRRCARRARGQGEDQDPSRLISAVGPAGAAGRAYQHVQQEADFRLQEVHGSRSTARQTTERRRSKRSSKTQQTRSPGALPAGRMRHGPLRIGHCREPSTAQEVPRLGLDV